MSQVLLQLSRIGFGLVLARLLAPDAYGIAGMVIVFSSLVIVFSDLALGAALVQRTTLDEDDRSTVFWISVAAGVVFTLAGVAASGPIADFYGQPAVKPLFEVMSLSFAVTSLGTTQGALLMRELAFRKLELRLVAATVAGGIAGVIVAARGGGAWAIIAQQLTIACTSTALLWTVTPWRPRLRFSLERLRSIGGFSGNVLGQRLLYYVHTNADNLLIGRFLGAAPLGAYALAYNVMLIPFSRIAVPLAEVLFPAFARLQNDRAAIAAIWIRAGRIVGALSLPALAGLAVLAPDFVHVVLGSRWHTAVPVLEILTWVGLLQSLQTLNGPILQALDRTSLLLRYTIVFFVAHLAAFVIGLRWGVVGVAAAYAVSTTLVEPLFFRLTARALGVSPWAFLKGFTGVVQATGAMSVTLLIARHSLVLSTSPGLRLLVLVALGAVVYLPMVAWRSAELRAEWMRLRPRPHAAAASPNV